MLIRDRKTSDQTPNPLYAIHIAITVAKSEEIRVMIACVLKFNSIVNLVFCTEINAPMIKFKLTMRVRLISSGLLKYLEIYGEAT